MSSDPLLHLHHYDIESLAKSLQLTSIDVIKTSSMDIESHWFRAKGPADLYYWKTKNKIVKHQVSLFNQVVEWNEYDGVKTGYVNDEVDEGRAEVISFDESVNDAVIEQVIEFLQATKEVDPDVKKQLIANYKFYNRWRNVWPFSQLQRLYKKLFSRKK